jgi:hypothetical protein
MRGGSWIRDSQDVFDARYMLPGRPLRPGNCFGRAAAKALRQKNDALALQPCLYSERLAESSLPR